MTTLRHAARTLRANPGFALVAMLTLALGIGVNTAVFSVVHGTLLRRLPYVEPERLVMPTAVNSDGRYASVTYADYLDWRELRDLFRAVAVFSTGAVNLAGEGQAERVEAALVSDGFFDVLGVRPLLGRQFQPAEHAAAAPGVAILSRGLWQRRFGGDPAILGRTIRVNGAATEVVGVMPDQARWPRETTLWRPIPI
nr:ABC transporter permease [Thermoleophilaceae bacterium]